MDSRRGREKPPRRKAARADRLLDAALALHGSLSLDEVVRRVAAEARALTGAEATVARVALEPRPGVALRAETVHPAPLPPPAGREAARERLAVPLEDASGARVGELVLGGRAAARRGRNGPGRRALHRFARIAGLAIRNAHLNADAEQAEQRFQDLLEGLDAIVCEEDAETWRCTYVSRRAADILGYAPDAWLASADFLDSILHPEDREGVRAYRAATIAGDHELEYRVRAADGRVVWLRDIVRVVQRGGVRKLRRLMVDVTAARLFQADRAALLAAEHEARLHAERTERRLRELVDAVDGVVWEAEPHTGRFLYLSGRVQGLLGVPRERWLSEPGLLAAVAHPEDRELALGTLAGGTPRGPVEFRVRTPDGREVWLSARVDVERDAAGAPSRLRGLWVDVSSRRRTDSELSRVRGDLEHRVASLRREERRKDEYLAMLGHELRNPLAPTLAALGTARAAAGDALPPTAARALDVVERHTLHLKRLVDDLLDVSRLSAGTFALRREGLTLAELAERVLESVRPLAHARGQQLDAVLPERAVHLHADPVRLEQALGNLLQNAVKYTPPGGRVWLRAEVHAPGPQGAAPPGPGAAAPAELCLCVVDTGRGIRPELLPHVFELFVQEERALDRHEGGLGVGLTVVKQIAQLHGGRVVARSEGPGRGSEFCLWLPVAHVGPAAPAPRPVAVPRAAAAAPPRAREPESGALRVLVVDDNRDAGEMLAELLGLWGHEVLLARDGEEALATAGVTPLDVVLLDIGLPGLDGFEVARRLRQLPAVRPSLKVVALSGYGADTHRARAREAGFDDYLTKPAEPDALRLLLERVAAPSGPGTAPPASLSGRSAG
jgi:two-component system CheB/CheR fusion protein